MNRFFKVFTSWLGLGIHGLLAQPAGSTKPLTVSQMQRDIGILQASLTSLHPGLYRYNTAEQIQQYVSQLRAQANRPLPLPVFYVRLAQFTAKLHCGHTYPNPFNLRSSVRQQLFSDQLLPVYFRICAGHWIITHNVSDNEQLRVGDEITAINTIPVAQITDSLLTVSRSDGLHGQAKQLDNLNLTPVAGAAYALFDRYFPLLFATPQTGFRLTVRPY